MRRFVLVLTASAVAAGLTLSAAPAGAQTGNVTEFCSARLALQKAFWTEDLKEVNAQLARMATNATAPVAAPAATVRDAFAKDGEKAFEKVEGEFKQVDQYVYESCPGTKVDVKAIDYGYEGLPATLKAGPTTIRLTNSAPKEEHEIVMAKLTPAGEKKDPKKLFAMPDKKLGKYLDFSTGSAAWAGPGEVGIGVADLQPGKYLYGCMIPVGGKKKGKPHYAEGMYGTFTVQ